MAVTGKGGGCVLASATAHVAEPQHTLSLYYPLVTNRSFYRKISPNFKRNLISFGRILQDDLNSRVTFDECSGQIHQRPFGCREKSERHVLSGLDRLMGIAGRGKVGCSAVRGKSAGLCWLVASPKRLCPYTSQHQP